MRRNFLFLVFSGLLFFSCNNNSNTSKSTNKDEQQSLISSYHHADSLYAACGKTDTAAFSDFINKTLAYVDNNPNDSIAPEMLYRAGIGSMILAKSAKNVEYKAENAKKALKIFTQFQDLYPENPSAKLCYWQRAIVYDDILGDWRSAETEYRDFINRYPNDSLAVVFSQYLSMLGKSEQEIESQLKIK